MQTQPLMVCSFRRRAGCCRCAVTNDYDPDTSSSCAAGAGVEEDHTRTPITQQGQMLYKGRQIHVNTSSSRMVLNMDNGIEDG
eukprot:scaffold24340_cov110-Skeletonema_dohrnii-CCMP3373.AAC.3